MDKKITNAVDLLATFKYGDKVSVESQGEKIYTMTVSQGLHRSDGPFGTYESSRITVTFGPGRYSRDITAEQIAAGSVSIKKAEDEGAPNPCELSAGQEHEPISR